MINKYALLKVIKGIIRDHNEFSLREIAKRLRISPSTSKATLDFLFSEEILEKRCLGRNHLFRIKDTFLTRHIKLLCSLAEIHDSGFVGELLTKRPQIVCITLYGSVAKGEDDIHSDIDILIISRKKMDIPELKSEHVLKREVTIINYTYQEWKDKADKDTVFYTNVILNCIQLYGEKPVVV